MNLVEKINNDMKLANSIAGEKVFPITRNNYKLKDGIFTTTMKKCSWNVIRFGK